MSEAIEKMKTQRPMRFETYRDCILELADRLDKLEQVSALLMQWIGDACAGGVHDAP